MIWHSKSELESEGRPNRKEIFYAIAATPILLTQIIAWTCRIFRGFQGDALTVSSVLEIEVLKSEPTWHFAAAIAMYLTLIVIALLLLGACTLQFQRWLFWRRRP